MKIQDALNTIDEMIGAIERAQESARDRSRCCDERFYTEMDARHHAEIQRYLDMRDEIERGLDYSC